MAMAQSLHQRAGVADHEQYAAKEADQAHGKGNNEGEHDSLVRLLLLQHIRAQQVQVRRRASSSSASAGATLRGVMAPDAAQCVPVVRPGASGVRARAREGANAGSSGWRLGTGP